MKPLALFALAYLGAGVAVILACAVYFGVVCLAAAGMFKMMGESGRWWE